MPVILGHPAEAEQDHSGVYAYKRVTTMSGDNQM